jgi:hypothetical protein
MGRGVALRRRMFAFDRVTMKRLAVAAATCSVLLFCGQASGATSHSAAPAVTPKQFCNVIQNPYLAAAVTGLARLLPPKFQPTKSLKIVIGAVAAACPAVASLAVKVHERYVSTSSQAPARPTVYQPLTSLMAARTMNITTGSAYAFVSWSGANVSGYQEQTRAGSRFDSPVGVGPLAPSVWRPVTPGNVYRFFVRGLNAQNQPATGWAQSAEFEPLVLDSRLNGSGWATASTNNAYGGTVAYGTAGTAGDITYTPTGFAMAIVAPTFPKGGTADVYVDGAYARRISFYSPTTQPGRLVFSWSWLLHGQHRVVLRPVSGEVDLDAELVLSPA